MPELPDIEVYLDAGTKHRASLHVIQGDGTLERMVGILGELAMRDVADFYNALGHFLSNL